MLICRGGCTLPVLVEKRPIRGPHSRPPFAAPIRGPHSRPPFAAAAAPTGGSGSCRTSRCGNARSMSVRAGLRDAATPKASRLAQGVEGWKRFGYAPVHVGAPAGANAARDITTRVGRGIAEFAAAAAPTGGSGSCRASTCGNARSMSVRAGRREVETLRVRVGLCRSAGRRECGARDCEARRSLDRRIRGCRRSYRGRRFV